MQTLWQDLRYGLRMLLRAPGFTAVAVLSLALGIGANTALFSVVDAMLLKKLPVKDPDRLVLFKSTSGPEFSPGSYTGNNSRDPVSGQQTRTSFPFQSLVRFREQVSGLSSVFAFGNVNINVNVDGQADVVSGQAVSGNYYSGLGVQAIYGRVLNEEDDRAGANPVAVNSHRYLQRRFGDNPTDVGRQINLNNTAFTIVGVTQPGFEGTMQAGSTQDVSIPIAMEPLISPEPERSRMYGAGVWWLRIMGRLKTGATAEQVHAGLEQVFQQSVIEHRATRQTLAQPPEPSRIATLEPGDYPRLVLDSGAQGEMDGRRMFARPLYLLLGTVALVLLIACANVANLLLSRAASRRKEIGVRLALGASRGRLIRQLLTESVLLAVVGGALGVLTAVWIQQGLLSVSDWAGREMRALEPQLDLRVLGFTLGLSLVTGLVFGIAPAWRATKVDLSPTLKDSGRGSSAASRSVLSKALVVTQVALSLLLLVGAGLFLRTLINLQRVNPGFNANNLLLFGVEPGLIGYKGDKLVQFYRQLTERVEAVPGVERVTFSRMALLSHGSSSRGFFLTGATIGADGRMNPAGDVYVHQVRENFLEAMEIPLLAGRPLSERDQTTSPRVAVVNETLAKRYFRNESPVGKRFGFSGDKLDEVEIVGLAQDAKYARQRDDVPATAYLPYLQELRGLSGATIEVRTIGDPAAFVGAIRQAVKDVDSTLPLTNIRTQVEQAGQTLAMERLFAKLLSLFGLLAQQLASIGLYGVLAYSVAQRTNEIGIRMALGAQPPHVLKMVLRQGMTLTILGVALGLVGAYVLTRFLETQMDLTSMLYGVKLSDPLTYCVTAVVLTLVALVACYVPARRASRVDPMIALRYE